MNQHEHPNKDACPRDEGRAVIMLAIVQLNRETIIDAAISILNSYGLADMTMRRVAKQLEVAPGALYWHFKNKQELIDATARCILQPIFKSGPLGDDDGNVEKLCAQLRDAMIRHRDGAEVVSAALSNAGLRADLEKIVMLSLHTPDEVGAFTLVHFVVGAVLAEQTQSQLQELMGVAGAGDDQDEAAFEQRFTTGVEIIIAGLKALGRIR